MPDGLMKRCSVIWPSSVDVSGLPAVRTLTRLGLIDRVHSDGAARKVLEKLLDPEDLHAYLRFVEQVLINTVGTFGLAADGPGGR